MRKVWVIGVRNY